MTKIIKPAQAGTVESSDILILLSPADPGSGIEIELVSPTVQQYGKQIRKVIIGTLAEYSIEDAFVNATDNGALDYTIEARMRTAIARAIG